MKIFVKPILILISLFVIYQLYSRITSQGEIEDSITWSDKIPGEYLQLLKLSDTCCRLPNEKVLFVKTVNAKYRNPVSSFYIENRYYLQVYKMDSTSNHSLKNLIENSFSNAHTYIYKQYASDDRTDMEFLYKLTKPHAPNKVYFDLFGDSTRILKKSDTIAYYYSRCSNFSIKFNLKDYNDIYGQCKSENINEVPLELMFLKRNKNVYLLILTSKNASTSLRVGTLYNLFLK